MAQGVVKWFNVEKGFGFIESGNKDYFVHFKSIQGEGFKTLNEGDKVTFIEGHGAKGAVASDVSVIRD